MCRVTNNVFIFVFSLLAVFSGVSLTSRHRSLILRLPFSVQSYHKTLMAPHKKGGTEEIALLGQARAFLQPFRRFLRRDSQLSPLRISQVSLGGPYNNCCRGPPHDRPTYPRPQGSLGRRRGLPHLRTDPGPSPSRGSTPPSSEGSKVSHMSRSIPRFQLSGGDGVRGSAKHRRKGDPPGKARMVLLHAEACWGKPSPSSRRVGSVNQGSPP